MNVTAHFVDFFIFDKLTVIVIAAGREGHNLFHQIHQGNRLTGKRNVAALGITIE